MTDDLISRQAVLDGIDTYINKAQSTGTQDDFYSFAELVVKALPSVNPQEPKTGHWIDAIEPIPLEERNAKLGFTYKDAGYKCSECGAKHEEHRLSMIATKTNYCPNCGARMERKDEE